MNARSLLILFDATYAVALAAWVGSILFFTFGVAPLLSRVLDAGQAARFGRALLPRYYSWGAQSGALALAALVCGRLTHPEFRGVATAAQALAALAGVLLMLYGGNTLAPALDAARDGGAGQSARLDRLRRRAIGLDGAALLIGIGLLAAFAARPAPRSDGIAEPTPEELARRHYVEGLREIERFHRGRADPPASAPGLQTGTGATTAVDRR